MAPVDGDGPIASTRRPSPPHIATAILLLAMAVAVAADAEWWPVSSMRLFSSVRGPTATSWRVTLVADGREQPLDFGHLDRGFHGAHQLIPRMAAMEPEGREAICSRWAEAAARRGQVRANEVRVERVVETLSPRGDLTDTRVHPAFRCRVRP